jgi:hypothetical protein
MALHPGWEYHLWTLEKLSSWFPAMLPEARDAIESPNGDRLAVAATFARYEVLRLFGGIYADCDIMLFRSFYHLLPEGERLWYTDWRPGTPSNLCMVATSAGLPQLANLVQSIGATRRAEGPIRSDDHHKRATGDMAFERWALGAHRFRNEQHIQRDGQRVGAAWDGFGHLCYTAFPNLSHALPGDHDAWRELINGSKCCFGVHEVACTWFGK